MYAGRLSVQYLLEAERHRENGHTDDAVGQRHHMTRLRCANHPDSGGVAPVFRQYIEIDYIEVARFSATSANSICTAVRAANYTKITVYAKQGITSSTSRVPSTKTPVDLYVCVQEGMCFDNFSVVSPRCMWRWFCYLHAIPRSGGRTKNYIRGSSVNKTVRMQMQQQQV